MELIMMCENNHLVAADPMGLEELQTINRGEQVRVKVTRMRNAGHHRKFFALLKAVYDAQNRFATMEQLLNFVKVATGYCDVMEIIKGKPIYIPKSIRWARMNQTAFEEFYEKVVKLILEKILPGVDASDLEARVNDIIEGRA